MNGEPHVFTFKVSDAPIWRVMLIDGTWWTLSSEQKPPNAFHRLMHRLVFGLKWERI